jgi:hypothetical protein
VLVHFATSPPHSKAGRPFSAEIAVARKDTGKRVRSGKVLCSARLGTKARVTLVHAGFRGGLARCSWRIPAGTRSKMLRGSVGLRYRGARIYRSFAQRIG